MGFNLAFNGLKMRPLLCLRTSGTNYPETKRHIPQKQRPHPHSCKCLKTHSLQYLCIQYFVSECNI